LSLRRAAWHELDPRTLHDIVRLRIDVFVVEQTCPYPELDGRDLEPSTEHIWVADESGVAAYLRVLAEDDGARRIGRVATRRDARGAGLAARLVQDAVARHGHRPLVLDAQSYLTGFYERFGFTSSGPEFLEDGILHVPMRRPAGSPAPDPQGSEATSSASSTRGPV
jgi:ElaA protein